MRDGVAEPAPGQAFRLTAPDRHEACSVIFASPHSGRFYPVDMAPAATLDPLALRRSEDAYVDRLLAAAPGFGISLLCATYGRAYLDVNREAWELDPGMFAGALPARALGRTARVAAGLGSIARVAGEGRPIYDRKLTLGEAEARIDKVHVPYHAALARLVEASSAAHGSALLVDWHSMPSAAVRTGARRGPDFVLGDRYGASCDASVTAKVERELTTLGFSVVRNVPYAGGYTTEAYGRPNLGVHALQVEVNRDLYLDEVTMTPHQGFSNLATALERLFGSIRQMDWSALQSSAQKNRARRARW